MSINLPAPVQAAPLITDWIRFSEDRRLQILSGRVELGQGNMTALLQIAADELDIAPEAATIVGGDTSLTPNEGFTAGSLSITIGGKSLRLAASAARHVLLTEAAKLLQAPEEALSVDDGRVLRAGDETDLDLWRLAQSVDLAVPIADHAAPKAPAERRLSGTSLPRIELAPRIIGAPFVHDLEPEGMLHGRPVHPPTMAATLVSLDMDGLKARPGVVATVREGSFVGVIAETEAEAVAAAQWARNRAEWDVPGDAPADVIAAIGASDEPVETVHQTGDVESIKGRVFETTVSRPYLNHASIGPAAALAQWRDGALSVWTHSQGVYPLRAALATVFGMAEDSIVVSHRPGAGCYGHNGADDVALDAALLARAVPGRPVKVVWSRLDEFAHAPLGPGMVTRVRAVVGEDDRIAAISVMANSAPHGNRPGRQDAPNLRAAAFLEKPFPLARSSDVPLARGGGADRNAIPLYAIPNLTIAKRIVHGVPYRTSSLRALGGFTNVFALETLMDDIALELDEDPIAFRLRHLEDARARAVIERVAEAGAGIREMTTGEGAGWGLGFARYKNTAAYCAILARVEVDEAVRVTHVHAALDTGEIINPDGVCNQTEGGIIQAISWTLKEAVRFDGTRVATENWLDYPILTFPEVPEVEVHLIDRPDEPPLGCAEAAQGPTAAALGNAVRSALGVRVNAMPLDRDAILAAMA